MRVMTHALIPLFLLTFLTGCSIFSTSTQVVLVPPSSLLLPTPVATASELGVVTYGDLIDTYIPYLKGQVWQCNGDKESIKNYIEEHK